MNPSTDNPDSRPAGAALPDPALLQRQLGLGGAVLMGLGAIVGTGVFVSTGVAYSVAGAGLLPAVALAAVVAICNGLSSAQLAAAHPVAGGTYEYGYRFLHPAAGHVAGWMFLCAKSASAATAALGLSGYLLGLLPGEKGVAGPGYALLVGVALLAVAGVTVLVLLGIRRSRDANVVLVTVTLGSLLLFVFVGGRLIASDVGWKVTRSAWPAWGNPTGMPGGPVAAMLQATALMFVAYTGYGRIATLGEEVRNPRRVIPRAVLITLAVSCAVYFSVAYVVVKFADPQAMAASVGGRAAPLEIIARQHFSSSGLVVLALASGAAVAMFGVLLNLILGLSRVWLAMGRRRDMPGVLARLDRSGTTPRPAVVLTGLVVAALVLIGDIRTTWTFSAFTVLIYYALTNLACLALPREFRRFPRALAAGGLLGCGFLAFWVPWEVWLTGLGLIAAGLAWHAAARRLRSRAG